MTFGTAPQCFPGKGARWCVVRDRLKSINVRDVAGPVAGDGGEDDGGKDDDGGCSTVAGGAAGLGALFSLFAADGPLWLAVVLLALLAIVGVNGVPGFLPMALSHLDGGGQWIVSGTAPPGLTGAPSGFTPPRRRR